MTPAKTILTAAAVSALLWALCPSLSVAKSIADVLALLKAHQSKLPKASWIVGFGYDDSLLAEKRHSTRDELDRVAPSRTACWKRLQRFR